MPEQKRILVFLPNWVGDAVMATPSLSALRARLVDWRIIFVGKPSVLEILSGGNLADECIPDISTVSPRFMNMFRMTGRVWRVHPHAALMLPNSFRAAWLAFVSGAGKRVGYNRDGRGWLLTDTYPPRRDIRGRYVPVPAIDYYARLMELLNVDVPSRCMTLSVTSQGEEAAERLLVEAGCDSSRPLVMLNPGGAFGPSKMWETAGYAEVADELTRQWNAQIIINSAPGEQLVAEDIGRRMKTRPLVNFATRSNSLSLLKSLMRRCRLLITNDTGARHVGVAMGIDVVTIFASTDPRWTELYYPRERSVRTSARCAPCQSKFCLFPAGPMYQQCTRTITADMVLAAATELMATPRAGLCREASSQGGAV